MDIELLISQYIDGELSSDAEADLHHRLAVSPEARAVFRAQLALRSVAHDSRILVIPANDLKSRLFNRLQQEGFAPEALPPSLASAAAATPVIEHSIPSPRLDRADHRRRRRAVAWALVPIILLALFIGREYLLEDDLQKGTPIAQDFGPATSGVVPGELPSPREGSPRSLTDARTDARGHTPPSPLSAPAEDRDASLSTSDAASLGRREVARAPTTDRLEQSDDAGTALGREAWLRNGRAATPSSPPPLPRHRGPQMLGERLPDDEVMSRDSLSPHLLSPSGMASSLPEGGGSGVEEGDITQQPAAANADQARGSLLGFGNLRSDHAGQQIADSTRGQALSSTRQDDALAPSDKDDTAMNGALARASSEPAYGSDDRSKERSSPVPLDPSMVKSAKAAYEKVWQALDSLKAKKARTK